MPGLASADRHVHSTHSISRMHAGPRSNVTANDVRTTSYSEAPDASRNDLWSCFHSKDANVEESTSEESLSVYCKPVELYNIIRCRSLQSPIFLQRCLSYKIQSAYKKRIRMTVKLPKFITKSGEKFYAIPKSKSKDSPITTELQEQQFCSVFVMLTGPVPDSEMIHAVYRLSQTRVLYVPLFASSLSGNVKNTGVTFLLPDIHKLVLSAARDGGAILFIICADPTVSDTGIPAQTSLIASYNGPVLWGSISIIEFCRKWLSHFGTGDSATSLNEDKLDCTLEVELYPSRLQHESSLEGRCIRFRPPTNVLNGPCMARLEVQISADEVGRMCQQGLTTRVLSQAQSLRAGRVLFHYYFHFNEQYKTEVTEGYTCPFCLVGCASFQGLRCHLNSSHDLFNFEFIATIDQQAVKVTCQNSTLMAEGANGGVDGLYDPRLKNFVYWSRLNRPRTSCDRSIAIKRWLDQEQPLSMPLEKTTCSVNVKGTEEPTPMPNIDVSSMSQNDKIDRALDSEGLLDGPCTLKNELYSAEIAQDDFAATSSNSFSLSESGTENLHTEIKSSSAVVSEQHKEQEEQEESGVLNEDNDALQLGHQESGKVIQAAEVNVSDELKIGNLPENAGGNSLCFGKFTDATDVFAPHALLQQIEPAAKEVEKNRKISTNRLEARNLSLLQKRQFFHSRNAQPMAIEELTSDRDSEDEVDDEIADIEDRLMLNDFVDVTQDDKEVMHMWNSFARKQRVLADGHCQWACEAFSKLHAKRFAQHPLLRRSLLFMLIEFWKHHLVDGGTIDRCLSLVASCEVIP